MKSSEVFCFWFINIMYFIFILIHILLSTVQGKFDFCSLFWFSFQKSLSLTCPLFDFSKVCLWTLFGLLCVFFITLWSVWNQVMRHLELNCMFHCVKRQGLDFRPLWENTILLLYTPELRSQVVRLSFAQLMDLLNHLQNGRLFTFTYTPASGECTCKLWGCWWLKLYL